MSAAYDIERWSDLFVASAGASAALAGLVFVAVSINLEQVLQMPGIPARALETLTLLLGAVVVSLLCLVPQSSTALGVELALGGALLVTATAMFTSRSLPHGGPRSWIVGRMTIALLSTAPFLVAGASVLAEAGGGLYWAFAGVVIAILGGVTNAWVLLVEIRR